MGLLLSVFGEVRTYFFGRVVRIMFLSARDLHRLDVVAFCLFCLMMSYIGYHFVHGEFGLNAFARMRSEEAMLIRQLASLRERMSEMEMHVALLRPEKIDPDMLDQQVRESLNFAHKDEIIVLHPEF